MAKLVRLLVDGKSINGKYLGVINSYWWLFIPVGHDRWLPSALLSVSICEPTVSQLNLWTRIEFFLTT